MDKYEDGRALVKTNDLPGSDLPKPLPEERRVPRQNIYLKSPTSRNYDFDKHTVSELQSRMGGVI